MMNTMPRFDAAPRKKTPQASIEGPLGTVSEIRRRNLMWLRKKFQEDMQRKYPDEPDRGMDKAFAERIELNPKYFGHIKSGRREVGNALARKVEHQFALPVGWMDAEHADSAGATEGEAEIVAAALQLYREKPEEASRLIMKALREHLANKVTPKR